MRYVLSKLFQRCYMFSFLYHSCAYHFLSTFKLSNVQRDHSFSAISLTDHFHSDHRWPWCCTDHLMRAMHHQHHSSLAIVNRSFCSAVIVRHHHSLYHSLINLNSLLSFFTFFQYRTVHFLSQRDHFAFARAHTLHSNHSFKFFLHARFTLLLSITLSLLSLSPF